MVQCSAQSAGGEVSGIESLAFRRSSLVVPETFGMECAVGYSKGSPLTKPGIQEKKEGDVVSFFLVSPGFLASLAAFLRCCVNIRRSAQPVPNDSVPVPDGLPRPLSLLSPRESAVWPSRPPENPATCTRNSGTGRSSGNGLARPAFLGCSLLLAALLASGCHHLEREVPGRPPRPLPSSDSGPIGPRFPGFALRFEPTEQAADYQRYTFRFDSFSEADGDFKTIEGQYYRSLRVPPGERGPLLLVSPILAGPADNYLSCRVFSRWACAEGISAFYLHQPRNILSSHRDARALELFFQEDIRDNLKALQLLSRRPEVDPRLLGSFGISLGSIKNVMMVALEPRLVANAFCLSGSDLASILLASREGAVEGYIERRVEREGRSRDAIGIDLRHHIQWTPGDLAESIANDRALLFLGSLDNKVPFENGLLLRERMGRPETHIIPFGHYTAIVAAPFAAKRSFRFMKQRFDAVIRGGSASDAPSLRPDAPLTTPHESDV